MAKARPTLDLLDFVLRHAQITSGVHTCQRHENGYRLPQRTVSDHNLLYVTRGRALWRLPDQNHHLKPGDLLLVVPGVVHEAHSLTRRFTLLSLHVTAVLPGGRHVFDVLVPPSVQAVTTGSRLDRMLRMAMGDFEGMLPRNEHIMAGWDRLIITELLTDNAARSLLATRALHPVVAALLALLEKRLATPTTLEDLASLGGYSPQYLNRIFRHALGVTPLQYLTRLRLGRAAELLRENRLTIRAVARQVGYDDPYHFSRAFRQQFGHSPRDHRQNLVSEYPS